ncbi:MAG: hypothetical protein J6336_04840 [Kiritimatiellae bacterium]|nr:hypothetical protein [Kiritimatiellia bacterium]
MRFHTYWVTGTRTIRGHETTLRVGSDHSENDARERMAAAFDEIEAFQTRLQALTENEKRTRPFRDGREPDPGKTAIRALRERFHKQLTELFGNRAADGTYEQPICEEILRRIDPRNVITRNRYGAEVLNSETVCFLDIDDGADAIQSCILGCLGAIFILPFLVLGDLFGLGGNVPHDGRKLFARLRRLIREPATADLAFRLYRTAAGYRVIVNGAGLAPDSERFNLLVKRLHVDPLYAILCRKQRCFRARLTPKPHRLRQKQLLYPSAARYPITDPALRAAVDAWLPAYTERCRRYAVCRFLGEVGTPFRNPIVTLHDEATGALSNRPLR